MTRETCGTGTGEPFMPQQPKIADRCPTCGAQSLFIGAGGWLTCGVIGCKEPGVSRAVEDARERHQQQVADANAAIKRLQVALAAAEARERELREALDHLLREWMAWQPGLTGVARTRAERTLSRSPGGSEALRALLTSEAAVEAVAAVEHDQWWQWAVSVLDTEPGLSHDRAARWRSLFVPYAELSDGMKEHDRRWARKALAAIVARLLGPQATEEGGAE